MLTHLGSLTIRQCVPLLDSASAHLEATIGIGTQASAQLTATLGPLLASLNAKLEAALKAQLALTVTPPSIQAQIDACFKMIAALQATLALGLPVVSMQLAALAKLIASLQAQIAGLALDVDFDALLAIEVDFAAELTLLLGTPGLHAYTYTGAVRDFGDELAVATDGGFPGGNPGDGCAAVIFAASDGGAIEALQQVFAVAA